MSLCARQQTAFLHGFCLVFPCEPLPWLCLMMDHVWGCQPRNSFLPPVAFDWSVSSQQRNEKQSQGQAGVFRCRLWKWQPAAGFFNLVCAGPHYPVPAGIFLLFVLFGHVTHQHTFRRKTSRKGRLPGALCLPESPSHLFSSPLVLIDRWPIFFFFPFLFKKCLH